MLKGEDLNYLSYLHINNCNSSLVVWFSAFTRGPKLGTFFKSQKRFHGYRSATKLQDYDWLLVKEISGYTKDGTYYSGAPNNFFVEDEFVKLFEIYKKNYKKILFMGTSMGGYAAMKFAAMLDIHRVALFAPHLDLKSAIKLCGRKKWIEYLYDTNIHAPELIDKFINRLELKLDSSYLNSGKLMIYLQTAVNDFGVYHEQVLPFVKKINRTKSRIFLDERQDGGHSTLHMSQELINYVIKTLMSDDNLDRNVLLSFPERKLSREEIFERNIQSFENTIKLLFSHNR